MGLSENGTTPDVAIESMGDQWRYVRTIFLAICWGDIPLQASKIGLKNRPYIW